MFRFSGVIIEDPLNAELKLETILAHHYITLQFIMSGEVGMPFELKTSMANVSCARFHYSSFPSHQRVKVILTMPPTMFAVRLFHAFAVFALPIIGTHSHTVLRSFEYS